MSDLFKVNVSVVITGSEGYLMVKRADDEDVFPGYWGIPGGTVEYSDSSLIAALQRECTEEIGIGLRETKIISEEIVKRDGKTTIYIVYHAMQNDGTPKALDGTAEVSWKTLSEARDLKLTPKTLEALEACL